MLSLSLSLYIDQDAMETYEQMSCILQIDTITKDLKDSHWDELEEYGHKCYNA